MRDYPIRSLEFLEKSASTARVFFIDDDPVPGEFAEVNLASPTAAVDVPSNGGMSQ
jgi:hypothetical protein